MESVNSETHPRHTTTTMTYSGESTPHSDTLLLALQRSQPNTRLFRALFSYIPLSDSPNENPHMELALKQGDFILVRGELDEDQFYFAENVTTGQSGLVPSNYVERVPDQALLNNAARTPSPSLRYWRKKSASAAELGLKKTVATQSPTISNHSRGRGSKNNSLVKTAVDTELPFTSEHPLQHSRLSNNPPALANDGIRHGAGSPSFPLAVPSHYSTILHDFTDHTPGEPTLQSAFTGAASRWGRNATSFSSEEPALPEDVCPYPPIDISKIVVHEVKRRSNHPRELTIEKRLNRSIVCSWLPPEDLTQPVSQYHVCVDGNVKGVVPGAYKCKALVEELELSESANLSIRAIYADSSYPASPDAACTVAIGAEAPIAAQHLRVKNVSPVSAELSWYPSDSNAEHIVLLNALKVGVVPSGIFEVQLNGLSPSTIYRASVRTKHPKAVLEKRPVERCIDFKTLPKIGQPDPPSNVQCEIGPQPESLLITWKPVSTQPKPPSRAAIDSYLVLGDGKVIAQAASCAADHVLLRLRDLIEDPPIFITVRSRTREGAISSDSNIVRVPRATITHPAGILSAPSQTTTTASQQNISADRANPDLSSIYLGDKPHVMTTMAMPSHHQAVMRHGEGLLSTLAPALQPAISPGKQLGVTQVMLPNMGPPDPQSYGSSARSQSGPTQSQVFPTESFYHTPHQQFPNAFSLTSLPQCDTYRRSRYPGVVSTALLPNTFDTAAQNPNAITGWTQPQQQQQQRQRGGYYAFHPKALYREQSGTAEPVRASVLEMESNYLLRHQVVPAGSPLSARASYYANEGAHRRVLPPPQMLRIPSSNQPRLEAMIMAEEPRTSRSFAPPLPRHLARLRSEEQLIGGTRSEPDLTRPPLEIAEMLGEGIVSNCRWFVALFDYDPATMSPNPNAQQEELPFRKHQLIKVYGDADEDGFHYAEINKRFGLVPSNMLIEIAQDEIVEERRRTALYPQGEGVAQDRDPVIRRMKWGSIKSRSYDNPEQRRAQLRGRQLHLGPISSARVHRHSFAEPSAVYEQQHPLGPPPEALSMEKRDRSLPASRPYAEERRYNEERMEGRKNEHTTLGKSANGYGEQQRGLVEKVEREERRRPVEPVMPDPSAPLRRDVPGATSRHYPNHPRPPDESRDEERKTKLGAPVGHKYEYDDFREVPATMRMGAVGKSHDGFADYDTDGEGTGLVNSSAEAYGLPRKMEAIYAYDSRQYSPNADGEQMELSFRKGDVITVYGMMDADGFYMGELNGIQGLVPHNYLQPIGSSHSYGLPTEPAGGQQDTMDSGTARPKGVMFSESTAEANKRLGGGQTPPTQGGVSRQISQSSNKTIPSMSSLGGGGAPTGGGGRAPAKQASQPLGKQLTKKTSDLNAKQIASNSRKSTQPAKKGEMPGKRK